MKKRPSPNDKRRHVRRDIGQSGAIVLPDGRRIVCNVRDISETGAKIVIGRPSDLPARFVLELADGAVRRLCERSRQQGVNVGVRFPERPLNR